MKMVKNILSFQRKRDWVCCDTLNLSGSARPNGTKILFVDNQSYMFLFLYPRGLFTHNGDNDSEVLGSPIPSLNDDMLTHSLSENVSLVVYV